MRFEFNWDSAKAEANRRKHGVAFEEAMGVFADPLTLSRLDEDSGGGEERWVTLGRNLAGSLLLVVHTYHEASPDLAAVQIISARKPTRCEVRQYEDEVTK
jgi:uncharacterized protein